MPRALCLALAVSLLAACSDDKAAVADCVHNYCGLMATACTAAGDVQYSGLTGTCEAYCAANPWAEGTPGTTGDTLACRIDHANNALNASGAVRTLHCGHAGPSGGNVCGTWCQNYCDLATRNCSAYLTVGQMGFTDTASCLTACAAFPTTGTINGAGNNVQCRIYHAGAAATSALPHCGHAAVTSGNTIPATAAGPCS